MIVNGGSQGLGSGVVQASLERNYSVVAASRNEGLSPMGIISSVQEIVDAVIYMTEAPHVTGEVLHVDGGAHIGKW